MKERRGYNKPSCPSLTLRISNEWVLSCVSILLLSVPTETSLYKLTKL